MEKNKLLVLACAAGVFLGGCGSPKASTEKSAGNEGKETKASNDEIVLSPEQQAAAMIETRPAVISRHPEQHGLCGIDHQPGGEPTLRQARRVRR